MNLIYSYTTGFSKLVSPNAKAGKTLFGPIHPNNSSVQINGLIRLDQFCYNCNIICLLGLQNPIQAYTNHQSISPSGLIKPEQFRKAWFNPCLYLPKGLSCVSLSIILDWVPKNIHQTHDLAKGSSSVSVLLSIILVWVPKNIHHPDLYIANHWCWSTDLRVQIIYKYVIFPVFWGIN